MTTRPPEGPLSRFKVLDLARVRSGPTCVRHLADWGADVLKIEPPMAADPNPDMGGPRDGPDFQNLHRNRRAMTLNLKAERGREILLELVKKSDVLVENFRPGVLARLGLGYETLAEANPRIVLGSISAYGQTGPYSGRPGFDQIAQGMGGLMSVTGLPGQGPVRAGIPVADLSAGNYLAMGILLALLEREVSGTGQWVKTSLLEAMISMLDFQAARYVIAGEVAGQAGNDHPTTVPTGLFPTADGHINIAAGGETMWRRICDALGAPDLRSDPVLATEDLRRENRDAVNAAIGRETIKRTTAEWVDRFNATGVPSGPVYRIDEMFADPQVRHLGMDPALPGVTGAHACVVGQPVSMSRSKASYKTPAPERGADTKAVLAELGYEASDVESLRDEGVI